MDACGENTGVGALGNVIALWTPPPARDCRKDRPVPGTFAVKEGPRGPAVTLRGPTPTEVEMPLGESVTRTPGSGENDLRNRQAIISGV